MLSLPTVAATEEMIRVREEVESSSFERQSFLAVPPSAPATTTTLTDAGFTTRPSSFGSYQPYPTNLEPPPQYSNIHNDSNNNFV